MKLLGVRLGCVLALVTPLFVVVTRRFAAPRAPIAVVTQHTGSFNGETIKYTATVGGDLHCRRGRRSRSRHDQHGLRSRRREGPERMAGHVRLQRRSGRIIVAIAYGRLRPPAPRRTPREAFETIRSVRWTRWTWSSRPDRHRPLTSAARRRRPAVLERLGRWCVGKDVHRDLAQGERPRVVAAFSLRRELRHSPGRRRLSALTRTSRSMACCSSLWSRGPLGVRCRSS